MQELDPKLMLLPLFGLQEFYYFKSNLPSSIDENNGWARKCYFDENDDELYHVTINSPLTDLYYSYKLIDGVWKIQA